jgi:hypothetical protein
MLLSTRLVQRIEEHADELTEGVVEELQLNKRTSSFHTLSRQEIHRRAYGVYRNLGDWLAGKNEEAIEKFHMELARRRLAEGVPLHELVCSLLLKKYRLRDYIRSSRLADSAVDLYQEQELQILIGQFFDKGIYYAVKTYETELASQQTMDELPVR